MYRFDAGKMLREIRRQKRIKAKSLCKGICSTSLLSELEKGKQVVTPFLWIILLERMGIEIERYVIMGTEADYKEWLCQEEIYEIMRDREWNRLSEVLQRINITENTIDGDIKKQFYYSIKGMEAGAMHKDYQKAAGYMKKAIDVTMCGILEREFCDSWLGVSELYMLALYLYYARLSGNMDENTAKDYFDCLEAYIRNKDMPDTEKVKIYAKVVCMEIRLFGKGMDRSERKQLCKTAINMLRATVRMYDIVEVLRLYMECLDENDKERIFYQKQYETFSDILQECGMETDFCPEQFIIRKPKFYIMEEYFYSKRKEQKLTQAQLSEHICEPESYSRIERGKTKPISSNVYRLAERLGMNWCYYRGELATYDTKVYQLRRSHRIAGIRGHLKEYLQILEEMENLLDMENPINRQYIKSKQCMLLYKRRHISEEEAYQTLKECLAITKVIDMEAEYLVYYSQTELEMIANMGTVLRGQKRYKEGILLLETILEQVLKSKVRMEHQWNGISSVLSVLSNLHFSLEDYEMSLKIAEFVFRKSVRLGESSRLGPMLDAVADDLEHMGEEYSEKYKKFYRHMYYIDDFYDMDIYKSFAKEYYKKFDSTMNWY